jgi:hypothetical protein
MPSSPTSHHRGKVVRSKYVRAGGKISACRQRPTVGKRCCAGSHGFPRKLIPASANVPPLGKGGVLQSCAERSANVHWEKVLRSNSAVAGSFSVPANVPPLATFPLGSRSPGRRVDPEHPALRRGLTRPLCWDASSVRQVCAWRGAKEGLIQVPRSEPPIHFPTSASVSAVPAGEDAPETGE